MFPCKWIVYIIHVELGLNIIPVVTVGYVTI